MEFVKENKPAQPPLSVWWLAAGLAASAALLAGVALLDAALPEPLGPGAPPERFHGLTAHRHLTNLTAIGPRVRPSHLLRRRGTGRRRRDSWYIAGGRQLRERSAGGGRAGGGREGHRGARLAAQPARAGRAHRQRSF